jgi:hypothetical protein
MATNSGDSSVSALTLLPAGYRLATELNSRLTDISHQPPTLHFTDWQIQVKVKIMLWPPVSLSLNKAPIRGLRPDLYYCQTVAGLLMWTAARSQSQSQSYVTTDCNAPIWGLRPDLYYCQTVAGLLMWGALSDERKVLSFARVTVSSNVFCQYVQFIFICY